MTTLDWLSLASDVSIMINFQHQGLKVFKIMKAEHNQDLDNDKKYGCKHSITNM